MGNTIRYTYDADGNQLTESSPAGTASTQYNDLNQKVAITAPDGSESQIQYDADGQVTKQIAPDGSVTTTAYNGHRPRVIRHGPAWQRDPLHLRLAG